MLFFLCRLKTVC